MALPMLDLPTYSVFIPSLEKEIKYRPFIVKEEKILLIALESNDFDTILNSTKQVLQNCIITEGVDVETLPLHEIEFLFLNLRARSMGEQVELEYVCENIIEDKKCKGQVMVQVDLLKAAIDIKQIKTTIKLTDTVGIKLKYPTMDVSAILSSKRTDIDAAIELIEKCTEYLFDDDQVYKPSEMSKGEFNEFISGLTQPQFLLLQDFFDDLPKVKYETVALCRKCRKEHKLYLEGLLDFFA
jgi:hypothetical protein